MRVEFDRNGFYADMDERKVNFDRKESGFKNIITENWPLTLGGLSLILSVVNLPFGLFMNLNKHVFNNVNGVNLSYWMAVLLVFSAVFVIVSISSGVFSIICYTKSRKKTTDVAGVLLSLISFLVCIAVIVLDILGLVI